MILITVHNVSFFRSSVTNVQTLPLNDAMFRCLNPDNYNFLYTDVDKEYWTLMSSILDSAVLQVINNSVMKLSFKSLGFFTVTI